MSSPCTLGGAVCQLHVAFGNAGALRVSWVSATLGNASRPSVEWGHLPDGLEHSVLATSTSYALDDLCLPAEVRVRGWEDPGLQHHAELAGALRDGRAVYYRVGFAASGIWSNVTGPVTSVVGDEARLAVFGDMGTYAYAPKHDTGLGAVDNQVATSLARAARERRLHAVVHVGDIAYAHDGPASRWRYWFDEIEPVASVTPYMIGCGNHEYEICRSSTRAARLRAPPT